MRERRYIGYTYPVSLIVLAVALIDVGFPGNGPAKLTGWCFIGLKLEKEKCQSFCMEYINYNLVI